MDLKTTTPWSGEPINGFKDDKDIEEHVRIACRKIHRDSNLSIRPGPALGPSIKFDRPGRTSTMWTFHTHAALSLVPRTPWNISQLRDREKYGKLLFPETYLRLQLVILYSEKYHTHWCLGHQVGASSSGECACAVLPLNRKS